MKFYVCTLVRGVQAAGGGHFTLYYVMTFICMFSVARRFPLSKLKPDDVETKVLFYQKHC
jgi:hypothetical protein